MRFDACGEVANLGKVFEVDGVGAPDRQRYAVHHQGKALAHPFQVVQRLAPGTQVVLGDDLEPVDRVRLAEHGLVVRRAKAKTEAQEFHGGSPRGRAGTGRFSAPGPFLPTGYFASAFAFASLHSSLLMDTQPW